MNEQEILNRIGQLEQKLEAVYVSVEKTQKYFLWLMWTSVALFFLPLLGLVFAIPAFLSIYSSMGDLGI